MDNEFISDYVGRGNKGLIDMKKAFDIILLTMIIISVFAGCGKKGAVVGITQETPPVDEITTSEPETAEDEIVSETSIDDDDAMEEDETSEDGTYEIPEEEQIDKPMGSGGDQGPDYSGE